MKALTVSQPYASLIASGEKWIENRTWNTNYRGPIFIHAGKGSQYLKKSELAKLATGSVIALARLAACVTIEELTEMGNSLYDSQDFVPGTSVSWWDAAAHKHAEGPFCWILENVIALDPIPCRGAQGLWKLPCTVLWPISEQLQAIKRIRSVGLGVQQA
jgi:activating signal cointegrator 1